MAQEQKPLLVNWSCLKIILRQRDREIITLRGSYNSRKQELANYILPLALQAAL